MGCRKSSCLRKKKKKKYIYSETAFWLLFVPRVCELSLSRALSPGSLQAPCAICHGSISSARAFLLLSRWEGLCQAALVPVFVTEGTAACVLPAMAPWGTAVTPRGWHFRLSWRGAGTRGGLSRAHVTDVTRGQSSAHGQPSALLAGRHLKITQCHPLPGQGHLPPAQFAPRPVRPGLELLYSEITKSSKHIFLLLDTCRGLMMCLAAADSFCYKHFSQCCRAPVPGSCDSTGRGCRGCCLGVRTLSSGDSGTTEPQTRLAFMAP